MRIAPIYFSKMSREGYQLKGQPNKVPLFQGVEIIQRWNRNFRALEFLTWGRRQILQLFSSLGNYPSNLPMNWWQAFIVILKEFSLLSLFTESWFFTSLDVWHLLKNPFVWFYIIEWNRKNDLHEASKRSKEAENQLGDGNYEKCFSSLQWHNSFLDF